MKRTATAQWRGDGGNGSGTLTTQSGVLQQQPYSFATRFKSEDGRAGTNPEELIAAAHAGCFSMALAFKLSEAGHPPEQLDAQANVEVNKTDGGFAITGIALQLQARVPGLDEAKFQELAAAAKANCPVSKALAVVPITLEARLLA